MTCQAYLAARLASAHQDSRAQFKSLLAGQILQRSPRNHLRLVEPSLALFATMQRNRNHRQPSDRHYPLQFTYRCRQHAPQNTCRRTHLLKLEHVDQIAQPAVVAAISNRALKWRIRSLAKQATRLRALNPRRDVEHFSANRAERSRQRSQRAQAVGANRKPGNFNQRRIADTAIGREKTEK